MHQISTVELALLCVAANVAGMVVGVITMRSLYQKTSAAKEARLTAVLERMEELGKFVRNEVLHIDAETPPPTQKK